MHPHPHTHTYLRIASPLVTSLFVSFAILSPCLFLDGPTPANVHHPSSAKKTCRHPITFIAAYRIRGFLVSERQLHSTKCGPRQNAHSKRKRPWCLYEGRDRGVVIESKCGPRLLTLWTSSHTKGHCVYMRVGIEGFCQVEFFFFGTPPYYVCPRGQGMPLSMSS